MVKGRTKATGNPGKAPTPPSTGAAMFAQFAKGSGQAPQYGTLAGASPANATARDVQSFDDRAIMQEEPTTTSGGPRGNPTNTSPRGVAVDGEDALLRRIGGVYDDTANMRADNQVLVRMTPQSSKSGKDSRPNGLRIYRDEAGENIR